MLDILVCPFDKESELELFEIKVKKFDSTSLNETNENQTQAKNIELEESLKNKQIRQTSDNDSTSLIEDSLGDNEKEEKNKSDSNINNISGTNNEGNYDEIIEEGLLFCNSCLRFYPIVEEIPIILPDDLRDKNHDLELLKKWSNSLPEKVVNKALPWHL
ncbi:MAG: hypothetical protein H0X03_09770 [Nitrosopumilus sp.]|nr:hypothetical protein [Nitrosopumilus sp.]